MPYKAPEKTQLEHTGEDRYRVYDAASRRFKRGLIYPVWRAGRWVVVVYHPNTVEADELYLATLVPGPLEPRIEFRPLRPEAAAG